MSSTNFEFGAPDRAAAVADDGDNLRTSQAFTEVTPDERLSVKTSALEGLRAVLAQTVQRDPITLKVPSRPGVTLRFDPTVNDDERKAWMKRCTKRKRRGGGEEEVDELLFACLVLVNTSTAVAYDGVDAHDQDGQPITLAHNQLREMVGGTDPTSTIRRLFVADAHVLVASGEVMLAAGYDDDLSADPTQA